MEFDDVEITSLAPGVVQINHSPDACTGEVCCLHNPSDHHMVAWPTVFRSDRAQITPEGYTFAVFVLTERLCPHGVGHPDPDSIAYARRIGGDDFADAEGIHGCDRCCQAAATGKR